MKMDFLEKNYIKIKLKYLKKAKVEYILSNILTILTVLATAIYPMLLSYIVDNYNSLNFSTLVYIFGILILSIIFLLMCTYFNKITKASFEKKITQSLREDVFISLLGTSYEKFNSKKSDEYVSFLVNDISMMYTLFFENLIYFSNSIIMLIVYTIILAFTSWQMTIVIMGSLLFLFIIPSLVGGKFNYYNKNLSSSRAKFLSKADEYLNAYNIIREEHIFSIYEEYKRNLEDMQKNNYSLNKYMSFVQIFSGLSLYIQLILCFCIGLTFAYYNIISIGIFTSSLLYVEIISQHSANMVNELLEMISANTYFGNLKSMLIEKFEKFENNNRYESKDIGIILKNINYSINKKDIIKNFSFDFKNNKKYLIVGENGSGKSTLLKIIYGILNPASGEIFNNGCSISYIPQERYIFEGTILENITLFNESIDDKIIEKINSLLKILNLKYSLNHLVDKDGKNLSGGEVCKICLIRELIKSPDLIIFDEPLNDLESSSRELIMEYIKKLDISVIVVDHSINDYSYFDEVIHI